MNNICKFSYISDGQITSYLNNLRDIVYYSLNNHENLFKLIVDDLKNQIQNKEKSINKIVGILYLIAGKFDIIKKGQKVLYNDKKAIIVNIHMPKNNECEIQIIKENEETKNIETTGQRIKVNKNDLIILNNLSKKFIKELDINILITYLNELNSDKNGLILCLILKILYQTNKEKLFSITEENKKKLIEILNNKSKYIEASCVNELERKLFYFLNAKYEKNYNKLNKEVFIPRYNTNYPQKLSQISTIENQVLPESEYISSLPQVSLNNGLSCLQNAIKFDTVFVEAIINAYRHDNFKDAVAMSTSQIRSHLLNGNLKSAYDDLSIVFENAPLSKNIFEDNYNPNKVTMEKCIIGKSFLCKDKKLKKEKLVILLFCDFVNKIILVMTTGPKIEIFWTSYENLIMLNTNYSALGYSAEEIDNNFKESLEILNVV